MLRAQRLKLISEYNKRREVYFELMGSLYPSMVYRELEEMRHQYIQGGGNPDHLKPVPPPTPFGYAPSPNPNG